MIPIGTIDSVVTRGHWYVPVNQWCGIGTMITVYNIMHTQHTGSAEWYDGILIKPLCKMIKPPHLSIPPTPWL